eukprot:gene52297-62310_t
MKCYVTALSITAPELLPKLDVLVRNARKKGQMDALLEHRKQRKKTAKVQGGSAATPPAAAAPARPAPTAAAPPHWGEVCGEFRRRHAGFHKGDLNAALRDELTGMEERKVAMQLSAIGVDWDTEAKRKEENKRREAEAKRKGEEKKRRDAELKEKAARETEESRVKQHEEDEMQRKLEKRREKMQQEEQRAKEEEESKRKKQEEEKRLKGEEDKRRKKEEEKRKEEQKRKKVEEEKAAELAKERRQREEKRKKEEEKAAAEKQAASKARKDEEEASRKKAEKATKQQKEDKPTAAAGTPEKPQKDAQGGKPPNASDDGAVRGAGTYDLLSLPARSFRVPAAWCVCVLQRKGSGTKRHPYDADCPKLPSKDGWEGATVVVTQRDELRRAVTELCGRQGKSAKSAALMMAQYPGGRVWIADPTHTTKASAAEVCDTLHAAMKGLGTDEGGWAAVCDEFRRRHPDTHRGDLRAALRSELTEQGWATRAFWYHPPNAVAEKEERKVQQQLATIGVDWGAAAKGKDAKAKKEEAKDAKAKKEEAQAEGGADPRLASLAD